VTDQQLATQTTSRTPNLRSGRTEWLQRWLEGETPDISLLEQQGFQTSQYYAVVIFRLAKNTSSNLPTINSSQLAAMLHVEASRRNICGPVIAYEGISAVLFHPVEDPQQTARLKLKTEQIRAQLATRLNNMDVHCGVGRPARGMDSLRQSFFEAEGAVKLSNDLQMQARSTFFGNTSLFNLLRSLKHPDELEQFCASWLGDLISYDAKQHSDLLDTLRAYFANNGNTALTAKELRIHRNTLAYRLNRIAEITRLDLEDADVRLNLHLALKAREVLSAGQGQVL